MKSAKKISVPFERVAGLYLLPGGRDCVLYYDDGSVQEMPGEARRVMALWNRYLITNDSKKVGSEGNCDIGTCG